MSGFGAPFSLLMAAITLVIILNIYTFASGVVKNTSVLIGLIIGTVLWSCFKPLTSVWSTPLLAPSADPDALSPNLGFILSPSPCCRW